MIEGNQTLQGGGSTIQIRGVTSGIVVDFTAPGTRPEFVNNTNAAVLTLSGSNTRVTGVTVEGTSGAGLSNRGIFGNSGLTNVHIDNVIVERTGGIGIYFNNDNAVAISGVTLRDTDGHGIYFQSRNTVSIQDTTIMRPGGSAVVLTTDNTATIVDSMFIDATDNGLLIYDGNQVTASRLTFDNPGLNGVGIVLSGNDLTLEDSIFTGTMQRGIRLIAAGQTLSGTGNIASGATFTDTMCSDVAGGHTGQITLDIGSCP